ncbi:hypothetical protein CDD82_3646 [Ophiocordyceps australis]|uniref:OBG-type G domain-containing protein n=1 Tax=Ophiocordyceps australis TaxID=1399860 RepID=A0A2C5Z5M0_9HYPO|nr:hypothetical protein CDD82_3646 [Ophiocordyceps australis]
MVARPLLCRLAISRRLHFTPCQRHHSTINDLPESHLNPRPDDYAAVNFADRAQLTLYAGPGGSGCVSFQREAYLPDGPPNGGDGGAGGNIYIQAVPAETSLHKLARRSFIRAGRGKSGQGGSRNGAKGDHVILTVPVGTVVREICRQDPAVQEAALVREWRKAQKLKKHDKLLAQQRAETERKRVEAEAAAEQQDVDEQHQFHLHHQDDDELDTHNSHGSQDPKPPLDTQAEPDQQDDDDDPQRHKWILHPGMSKSDAARFIFPEMPRRSRHVHQPPPPIHLDLTQPTEQPILLAAGGLGGLGNPHFASRHSPRPLFATRGDEAMTMRIELELKLLADVGLVGLPNAGKSTLLRALTRSRTRVGAWPFTTLQPNIGTLVLDKYSGRPIVSRPPIARSDDANPDDANPEPRSRLSVADIPGLIQGAHLDRGLGIAFLRHVERAAVLAFVIDLSAGNAVDALAALWHEVGLYSQMRHDEEHARLQQESHHHLPDQDTDATRGGPVNQTLMHHPVAPEQPASPPHISAKPWCVIATKADLPDTQQNFAQLKAHLDDMTKGSAPHPANLPGAWTTSLAAIPVSAIKGQGLDPIVHWIAGLLDAYSPETSQQKSSPKSHPVGSWN